ncbi:hypothetical protein CRG98_046960 [Punica granatum]|uniref:Squalene monooxygenase n=1 Tax=Punica granatum TaxID=22663 RepID=A0A2I0HMF2_PUNGR|nr:hypothetical protein CRG98_046960 [Punica granatum]
MGMKIKNGREFERVIREENENNRKSVKSFADADGISRDDKVKGSIEVIVVGAGVAGAALPYTLAKNIAHQQNGKIILGRITMLLRDRVTIFGLGRVTHHFAFWTSKSFANPLTARPQWT